MLNVEKTMIRILISLAMSIVAMIAHAQTWTQLQWGVNKSSGYPYSICMNISGSWSCIGSVNSGGVFSANASSMPAFTGGDCTSTTGSVALNCTKTGGVSFGYFATGTDASNLTGLINPLRMVTFLAAANTWTNIQTTDMGTSSVPASWLKTSLAGAWPGQLIENTADDAAAQTQFFMVKKTSDHKRNAWQLAFDVWSNCGVDGLFNIEAVNLETSPVGVISTPFSATRAGEVGIGGCPVSGVELAVRGSGRIRAYNYQGSAYKGSYEFGDGNASIYGDSSAHVIGFYPDNVGRVNITAGALQPATAAAYDLGSATLPFANVHSVLNVLHGSASGTLTIQTPAAAGTNTLVLPAGSTNFAATGGASQVVMQTSLAGAFTVARLACGDLSNAVASCSTDATNASNITSGTLSTSRLPTIPISLGGTGQTTKSAGFDALSPLTTAGDLLYGGASGTGTRLAAGTSSQVLIGGTTPSWGAVNMASMVSGVLPFANGGTNDSGTGSSASTPTPFCSGSGTLSATLNKKQLLAKFYSVQADITVTTKDTCTAFIAVPLGFTVAKTSYGAGRNSSIGMLTWWAPAGDTNLYIQTDSAGFPATADGQTLSVSGIVEGT